MMWFNPGTHNEENCYFCVHNKKGINVAKGKKIEYIATDYVALPVSHRADSPFTNAEGVCDFLNDEQIDDQFNSELMDIGTETSLQRQLQRNYL